MQQIGLNVDSKKLKVGGNFLRPQVPTFVPIDGLVPCRIFLKLEGVNPAGSIKLKTALQITADLEAMGRMGPDTHLIESSSGNLGVALSMVCASRGYKFTCVTDPNACDHAVKLMRAQGANVIIVTERDAEGGFLGSRIDLIKKMCSEDSSYLWVNQYANISNWRAHYLMTAPEVHQAFPAVDYLVVGVGTSGTAMGCARYFREQSPETEIIGVDAEGSVTFGGPPGKRHIPGLGTSRKPELADVSLLNKLMYVDEASAVEMCRLMASRGLSVGGSTGSVLCAVQRLSANLSRNDVVVVISPDMADKYLDSIYNDSWVHQRFPGTFAHLMSTHSRSHDHLSEHRALGIA